MEIIYEAANDTPFYRAQEVKANPILSHNHKGFLYVTDKVEQFAKAVDVRISPDRIGNTGKEKVLVTAMVKDKYHNPVPMKDVKVYRNGTLIHTAKTNESGEIYFHDTPPVPSGLISAYEIECEGIRNSGLLNFFADKRTQRNHLEMKVEKTAIMAGVDDKATIYVTLRDDDWYVMAGKNITISYKDTKGIDQSFTIVTNSNGAASFVINGLSQVQGVIRLKASYDMGTEKTESFVYIKVIG
jgi:hypothetical protein